MSLSLIIFTSVLSHYYKRPIIAMIMDQYAKHTPYLYTASCPDYTTFYLSYKNKPVHKACNMERVSR